MIGDERRQQQAAFAARLAASAATLTVYNKEGNLRSELWEDGRDTGRPDVRLVFGSGGSRLLRIELDRDAARVNDAVGLKVTIEGEGFLRSVPAPSLEPSGLRSSPRSEALATRTASASRMISSRSPSTPPPLITSA